MWKERPDADVQDLEQAKKTEKAQHPVLLRYRDPKQYMDVFAPLVQLEADYDRQFKESQTQNNIRVRWERSGYTNRRIAYFFFPNEGDNVKLVIGDELKLKIEEQGKLIWKARGHIVKITASEEIGLEISPGQKPPPVDNDLKYTVEFVWKSISFDRMRLGLNIFLKDENSVSEYIFFKILGYSTSEQFLKNTLPKQLSAPGLPQLNHFQINAVKKALITPLCLI